MNYKVSYKRHLGKTISYRILSTSIGFLAMWWASGSIKVGAAFGIVELVYKPIQYYIHERVWYKWIKFGLVPEKKVFKKELKKEESPKIIEDKILSSPKPSNDKKKVLNYSANR